MCFSSSCIFTLPVQLPPCHRVLQVKFFSSHSCNGQGPRRLRVACMIFSCMLSYVCRVILHHPKFTKLLLSHTFEGIIGCCTGQYDHSSTCQCIQKLSQWQRSVHFWMIAKLNVYAVVTGSLRMCLNQPVVILNWNLTAENFQPSTCIYILPFARLTATLPCHLRA